MSDLSNVQLIESSRNIETYTANLKIVIKKFVARDKNESLLIKMKLLESKKTRRIYDIREDKNILYILIHPNENINDLLLGRISKEAITKGHYDPIKLKELTHLFKYEESMCKIRYNIIINNQKKYVFGSGFFLVMNIKGIPFNKCLMTNNHVLNENFFKTNKQIEMEYNKEIKVIQIDKRRAFTSRRLDYTCIEIYDSDNIKRFFQINQQILKDNINAFFNKDIFILQFPQGEDISFSEGKILSASDEVSFIHNCSTLKGSSGSPVILRDDSSVIGLHHSSFTEDENNKTNSYNLSTSILSIIKDILKKGIYFTNHQIIITQNNIKNNDSNNSYSENNENNYIVAEYCIDDNSVYQNIKIINSYEQCKRENPKLIFDKNMENEKELKDNCKIEIEGKIIPFSYYYQFKDKSLRVKYIFTKKLKLINYLFREVISLVNIDLSNFKASNVTDMRDLFNGCKSLETIKLPNKLQNVITMKNMFNVCKSLKSVNLSNNNLQNVINMKNMFYNCSSLESIYSSNFKSQNVINMENIFYECRSLMSVDLSNFKVSNTTDMNNILSFFNSLKPVEKDYYFDPLISIDLSNFNAPIITNIENLFNNFSNLESINLSYFNAPKLNNLEKLFNSCESLKSIDLSNFNAKNINNMASMFSGCKSLISIDLSSFNTQSVNKMESMFSGCKSLISINLSKFNTQSVNNMASMFSGCKSLISIDLSSFNTQSVNKMESMFESCSSLKSIDLSKFNTQSVNNMKNMFYGCRSLKSIDLSSFNTQSVNNMENMFYGCESLESIDLSKFNTHNVINMASMFSF